MADNHIFADAFNYFMFNGKQKLKPESLHEIDSTELTVPYDLKGKTYPLQKERDILKAASIKYDEEAVYLLLGIENQSQIHYAMPVRNMMYDAIRYAHQVDEIAKINRKLLKEIDYMLLLTFICFFTVSENLGRVDAIRAFLQQLLQKNALLTAIATSQVISNVPAAIVLSISQILLF